MTVSVDDCTLFKHRFEWLCCT